MTCDNRAGMDVSRYAVLWSVVLIFSVLLAVLLASLLFSPPARAGNVPDYAGPYIVFEVESGRVIKASNADAPWYPASTTKMMTAYVTFEAIQSGQLAWTSPVRISRHAASQPPSKSYLAVGTVLTVENALKILMVKSANDIAVALAEAVAGSEPLFAERMNAAARQLGMTGSHFVNPHGLPDDSQIVTARDLGILARALLQRYPQHSGMFGMSSVRLGRRTWRNYNLLIDRYRGAIGFKTGYICASGYNLVAGARRGGKTVVAVVLGARSGLERGVVAKSLLDRGFEGRGLFGGGGLIHASPASAGRGTPVNMRPVVCARPRQRPAVDDLVRAYGTAPQPTRAGVTASVAGARPERLNNVQVYSDGGESDGDDDRNVLDVLIGPELRSPPPVIVATGGADSGRPQVARWAVTAPVARDAVMGMAQTAPSAAPAAQGAVVSVPPASATTTPSTPMALGFTAPQQPEAAPAGSNAQDPRWTPPPPPLPDRSALEPTSAPTTATVETPAVAPPQAPVAPVAAAPAPAGSLVPRTTAPSAQSSLFPAERAFGPVVGGMRGSLGASIPRSAEQAPAAQGVRQGGAGAIVPGASVVPPASVVSPVLPPAAIPAQ